MNTSLFDLERLEEWPFNSDKKFMMVKSLNEEGKVGGRFRDEEVMEEGGFGEKRG